MRARRYDTTRVFDSIYRDVGIGSFHYLVASCAIHCKMKPLSTLTDAVSAQVVEIQPGRLAPRLVEMGLYKGCRVRVLFRAPFNGPIAVDLGTSMLSLRIDEAEMVLVEEETGEEA